MNTKRRLKVVHIVQPFGGGVEQYVRMFIKYSDKGRYENIIILSCEYKNKVDIFENLGAKVFLVAMNRSINLKYDAKSMYDIYRILRNVNPDIVYSHSTKSGALARIPAKLLGIKSIYNPHGWAFDMNVSNRKKWFYIISERLFSYITDLIVAISVYEKEVALEYKIVSPKKILLSENGVDIQKCMTVSNTKHDFLMERGWDSDSIIIGMVGRISEQKAPDLFIKIAEELLKVKENVKFILVGDGELRNEIEVEIGRKKIENKFYITGWVENPQEYMSYFDIALLTSRWEGFGLVIPEYMVLKKPVIASAIGGIPNIISHNYNGFLVDNFDIEQYIKHIVYIIDNQFETQKIIDNAYKITMERFDMSNNIHHQENKIEELIYKKGEEI